MSETNKQIVLKKPGALVTSNGRGLKTKPKKTPLEEDEFTDAMSKIIQRDFFPELPKLEAQLAYIEATETNDVVKLREISERYAEQIKTPNATPSTFQTPLAGNNTPNVRKRSSDVLSQDTINSDSKIPKPEDSKSLDVFLNTYHSEDDASFTEIMKIEEEKRKVKYTWMYEREAIASAMNTTPALTSGGDSPQALEGSQDLLAITDGQDSDRGTIKLWNYTAKNTLMYIPDGVEENEKEKLQKRHDKEICHKNTRLSRDFLHKMAMQVAAQENAVTEYIPKSAKEKVGIDGKKIYGGDSPQVNGYGFVATPQIQPGVDASPMMTWGTIEGTPLHLETDVVATPGPVFKIPKASKRDQLAHKLAEKASKSQREKKQAAIQHTASLLRSPLGKSPSATDRLKLLSPAARKLIAQTSSPGILRGTDNALRASYTPTQSPSVTPQHKKTPGHTPKLNVHGNQTPSTSSVPSLTDNLLNLNNR